MNKKEYRLPAEWEPQQSVMLTWPHKDTDWAPYLDDIVATMTTMAREIARREEVMIVVPQASMLPEELRQMERVRIMELPSNDTWARDHGPIVLKRMQEPSPQEIAERKFPLCWLDFCFNGWGEKFEALWDNMLPLKIWSIYGFVGNTGFEDHEDFVLEGGSIETDGRGTLFTTSQCLLAPHRNQPLLQEEIEEQLKRRLRVNRVVWLDHGNLVGDDTDGHIDTIVRCAPDDTLVYVGCDDENDEQYEDFKALEEQLKGLRTADGKPYRLLRLPMPDAIYDDGDRLPATYANFLVINGAVLVPIYQQEAKDAEALSIVQKAFPDREMVPIDARTIIRQHGSVHCLTMQIPE
ncbi:MAG: agmatine deiminase family protein [Prevotella sp.]|nr:agmatine deiminase family protein [Prevotella sp.]